MSNSPLCRNMAVASVYKGYLDNFIRDFSRNLAEALSPSANREEAVVLASRLGEEVILYAMLVNSLEKKDLEMGSVLLKVIKAESVFPDVKNLGLKLKQELSLDSEKLENAAWNAKEVQYSGLIPVPDQVVDILDRLAEFIFYANKIVGWYEINEIRGFRSVSGLADNVLYLYMEIEAAKGGDLSLPGLEGVKGRLAEMREHRRAWMQDQGRKSEFAGESESEGAVGGERTEKDFASKDKQELDCFSKMRNLSNKNAYSKVSLRGNKWVPMREDNSPRAMDQIQKEAERETMIEYANLNQASNPPRNKHPDRGDDRRRDDRPRKADFHYGSGGEDDVDGWIHSNKFRRDIFEASKLQHLKGTENGSSQNLGSYGQFKPWRFGSSAGPKQQQQNLGSYGQFKQWGFSSSAGPKQQQQNLGSYGLSKQWGFGSSAGPKQQQQNLGSYGQFKQWGFGSSAGPKQQQQQSTNNERRCFEYNTLNKFALLGDEKKMPPMLSRKTGPSSSQKEKRSLQSVRVVITPNKSSRNQRSRGAKRTPAHKKEEPPPEEPENLDIIRLKSWVLFEEWLANHNVQESADSISATCPDISVFVNSVMGRVVEGKESQRVAFGELLAHLTTKGILPAAVVSKELGELLEFSEDLMIDLPFIWKYLGELIVPILAKGAFTFADLKSACENFRTLHLTVTLTEIINRLLKEKGPVFIKTQWETSKVNFCDFIPEVIVDEFLKKNNFGFIIGEGKVETKDAVTSMSEVENILLNFLVQDGDKVSDHVCEWVNTNVGSKYQNVDFIKALMRAVIKACIKNGKIVPSSLIKNSTLIKKFIETNKTRELACLSGILHLVVIEMESPAGLLVEIFQSLRDHNIVSCEAFLEWKSRGDHEPGKGVALASLTSFYVSLSEQ